MLQIKEQDIDMFKVFMTSLAKFFKVPSVQDDLEAFIIAGNPQNVGDVDQLEKEFQRKKAHTWVGTHLNR